MDVRNQPIVTADVRKVTPVVAAASGLVARLTTVGVVAGDPLQVVGPALDVLGGESAAVVAAGPVVEDAVVVDGDLAVLFVLEDGVVLGVAEGNLGTDREETLYDGLFGCNVLFGLVDALSWAEVTGLRACERCASWSKIQRGDLRATLPTGPRSRLGSQEYQSDYQRPPQRHPPTDQHRREWYPDPQAQR